MYTKISCAYNIGLLLRVFLLISSCLTVHLLTPPFTFCVWTYNMKSDPTIVLLLPLLMFMTN